MTVLLFLSVMTTTFSYEFDPSDSVSSFLSSESSSPVWATSKSLKTLEGWIL
jgi:hypothetical protein